MTELQRPTSFGLKPYRDSEGEEDAQLTPRSWKVQLLRLVEVAPRPIPVTCTEPRRFPHFETNRVSESSWTSDSTRSTDFTSSRCSSFMYCENTVNDNRTTDFVDTSSSFKVEGFATSAKTEADTEDLSSPKPTAVDENLVETYDEKCIKSVRLLRLSSSSVVSPLEDSNTTERENERKKTRNTLALSIQGDSKYWEKFRYSKDYQSSLMIETICNEVFNLKPSPRYKSLMKLSKENKDSKGLAKKFSLPLNYEENRWKVVEDGGTKEEIKSILPLEKESKRVGMGRKVDITPTTVTSFQKEGRKERERRRTKRYNSTTSSVFTTTTEEGDEHCEEEYLRIQERDKLLKGFGQAFHGYLTKRETEKLLRTDGQYLIRQMCSEDGFILSFRFDGEIRNYRIKCDASNSCGTDVLYKYHLEDRRKGYNSLDELVREGLITLYLDENAGSYIDLLVELAQFKRSDSLLQTPPAVSPSSRKNSRSASFRTIRLSSSSALGSGGCGRRGSVDVNTPSITVTLPGGDSMDIALLIHYFEEEIFGRLAKCQMCSNGLWGPSNKGLQCRDCKLAIHESCFDNVRSECMPDLTVISPFSTDLTTLVKGSYSPAEGTYCLPYILEKCINEVEQRGLSTEGIYRVSGSVEEIENLKNLFEKDRINTDLSGFSDIHSITGLTKFFFRQLPDSLITQEVFEEFTQENAGEMTMETVQHLILCLPPAHRITLKHILKHLSRVTKDKSENKMNAFNLSSVLMPSLVCPANMSFDVLESCTKLLHVMITHVEEFNF